MEPQRSGGVKILSAAEQRVPHRSAAPAGPLPPKFEDFGNARVGDQRTPNEDLGSRDGFTARVDAAE